MSVQPKASKRLPLLELFEGASGTKEAQVSN
jgi:hypothetical protein